MITAIDSPLVRRAQKWISAMTRLEGFQAMIARMEDAFTTQTAKRDQYDGLDWILAERQAMHAAVNAARVERRLPPLPITAVEHVENMACGHIDYVHKFALYCAELALGVEEPQP